MKALTLFILLFLTFACSMHNHHQQDNVMDDDLSIAQDDTFIMGTVRVGQKECLLYIETKENDQLVRWYPINLDESFQIDGIQIKFNYHPSKARQPENCIVDKVVAVDNVSHVNF